MNCKIVTAIVLAAALTGCATTETQYHWGEYENLVYKTYSKPDEATPVVQIEQLKRDIENAKAKGKPIPPGLYAHLGLMYAQNGNKSLAIESLIKEKEMYPESTRFIEGLIQRAESGS